MYGFSLHVSPWVSAGKALRFVDADDLAAPGTGPLFLFVFYETSDADLPDALQIVNHAHAVFDSIALVQMVQFIAGKTAAAETVFYSGFCDI
jgi:hypothetical protein